ncbi:hypothetical protein DV735_g1146, partial [Chaetothyriales sp. CBS 134920]
MNGHRPQVNGQHTPNGITSTHHHQATEAKIARPLAISNGPVSKAEPATPYVNGILHCPPLSPTSAIDQAPPEILGLVSSEHYLPIATIINRRTQATWHRLSRLIDLLAGFDVPTHVAPPGTMIKNQSRENLDKKERLLQFLKHERNDFIKLLVLLDWGRKADQVAKTISISNWLDRRREAYWAAAGSLAALKRDALLFQIPNPDLATAGEVLATGRVSAFTDIGYRKPRPLSAKQILAVLQRLNRTLSLRLALHEELPRNFCRFAVHDGRVTFTVPGEFGVDLSVLGESPELPFQFVDFRFDFTPTPAVPDPLRDEIERISNHELVANGLLGCYTFLHELTLSNKLVELHNQALELARSQWSGHLKVDLLRRHLIVQYWPNRSAAKSWLQIGVNKGADGLPSHIAVKCFREGKQATDFEPDFNLSALSFESLLSQTIARHSNLILDSIYDRLVDTPIFKEQELWVEQESSDFAPESCFLQILISKDQEMTVAIDPVTGRVNLSPASELTSRLQLELNRSKDVSQDFVPRLLALRCALAESLVLVAASSSPWQHLTAFRPPLADVRKLFASQILRLNFFRHPSWSRHFLLAVSHGADGDEIWILQLRSDRLALGFAGSRVIHRETLAVGTDITPELFELLAIHTSQLIAAHANAEALRLRGWNSCQARRHGLQAKQDAHLLSFDIPANPDQGGSTPVLPEPDHVLLQFADLDTHSDQCILTAIVRTKADPAVLVQLSASNPDSSIAFAPNAQQITFEIKSTVGTSSIDQVLSQVTRLHDLTACVQTIRSLTTMSLATVSMSSMTVNYNIGDVKDQSMTIHFPSPTAPARIDFEPVSSNIHARVGPAMSRMLNEPGKPFASNMKDVSSALTLTAPLMLALRDLEQALQQPIKGAASDTASKIRVHILVRQATMFGIQFFTSPNPSASPPRSQIRPLARLEILPQSPGKDLWLLRPALDYFIKYTNPFASPGLQNKLRQEIFTKPSPHWIRLDNAAVCLASRPQALLTALKDVIVGWVAEKGEESETVTLAQTQPPELPTLKLPPKVAAAVNQRPDKDTAGVVAAIKFDKEKWVASLKPEHKELLQLEIDTLDVSWLAHLKDELTSASFLDLKRFLKREIDAGKKIFPPMEDVYSWSRHTPLHTNIYIALRNDYPDFQAPPAKAGGGLLTPWAQQGVLMLNTALTVRAHEAGSHAGKGWEAFTQRVIDTVVRVRTRGVVFLAWGLPAAKRCAKITGGGSGGRHLVLKSVHPSPLSASKGFFDCGHFRKTNDWLLQRYGVDGQIDWNLGGGKTKKEEPQDATSTPSTTATATATPTPTASAKNGDADEFEGVDDADAIEALEELARSSQPEGAK